MVIFRFSEIFHIIFDSTDKSIYFLIGAFYKKNARFFTLAFGFLHFLKTCEIDKIFEIQFFSIGVLGLRKPSKRQPKALKRDVLRPRTKNN